MANHPPIDATLQIQGVDVTTSNPVPVATSPGGTQTAGYYATATFTPAANSHTALDANGAAAEFAFTDKDGNAPPSGASLMILSASLEIDGGSAEATAWRLPLYSVTPPSAYADDAAWDLPSGDRASWRGEVDLGTAVDKGSTQWVETHGINKGVRLAVVDRHARRSAQHVAKALVR